MKWLVDHLLLQGATTVYLWLAGILLLCGLGLPIPEDLSLISAGALAHEGVINVHVAFIVCFSAVLGGDTLAFVLGRLYGQRLLQTRLFKRIFTPKKQMRVRAYFRKYGSKVIFIGRFLPGLRFSIYFSAGTLKVRMAVFLIYDTLAAVLSVPLLVYMAWLFGDQIHKVIEWARRSEYGILALVAVVVAVIVFKTWRRRKARRFSSVTPSAPVASPPVPAAPSPPAPLPTVEKAP